MIQIPQLIQIKDQKNNFKLELSYWTNRMRSLRYFNLPEINQCFKLSLTIKIIIINLSKQENQFLILTRKKISKDN